MLLRVEVAQLKCPVRNRMNEEGTNKVLKRQHTNMPAHKNGETKGRESPMRTHKHVNIRHMLLSLYDGTRPVQTVLGATRIHGTPDKQQTKRRTSWVNLMRQGSR